MNGTSSVFRVGDEKLYTTSAGEGEPLVLVHGLAGSGRWWRKNIQAFQQHFRVITVDMAGFGKSRGGSFHLSDASDLLLRWMDALKIERCHMVGHSMGGYVATSLVARQPERVDRVVLVDPAVMPLHPSLVVNSLRLAWSVRYMAMDFWPVLVADTLQAGPRTLYGAIRELLTSDLSAELKKVQSDLLIIWGEKDPLLPSTMGRQLHHELPGSELIIIRGAGHNPMWDRPREFNRAVLDFLLKER